MQAHPIHIWEHRHDYLPAEQERSERRTRRVIVLTAVMMVIEVVAGYAFDSMALLADGWHMASHASALGITAFAYSYARRHAADERFSFGTWKVGVLGGFASAVVLAVIAALLVWASLARLVDPHTIRFDEAIWVACAGLGVNILSAFLLHDHETDQHRHDHNLRAAYLHVISDALTSVLAIAALLAGKLLGWVWMDPLMGLVGAGIILSWSARLVHETSRILLDGDVEPHLVDRLRTALEAEAGDRVADIHLWRVGPTQLAAIVSMVTHEPRPPEHYKSLVPEALPLAHVTVEVNCCPGEVCATS